MFGRDWELRTPMGRFRLVRSRGEPSFVPDERDLLGLLFFFRCALERELEARQATLALKAKLEGERYNPQRAEHLDSSECRALERWLAFMIQADEVRLEPQAPVRTRVVAARQQTPYTPPKPAEDKEEDHFIGLRLKDQRQQPVRNSRVRITFPDGSQKEAKSNSAGEIFVKGIAVTGDAQIEFLDFCTPGAAEAPVWPEEKEYRVKVTDEAGNGVPNVWVKFTEGKKYNLVPADSNGVAVYKTTSDDVSASFHDAAELGTAMRSVWGKAAALVQAQWLKPEVGKRTVLSIRGGALQEQLSDTSEAATTENVGGAAVASAFAAGGTKAVTSAAAGTASLALKSAASFKAFDRIALVPGQEHEISVQPHVSMARLVGVNFDTNKSFLLPTALPTLRRIKELYEAHSGETLMIVGHADSQGGVAANEKLSLERAQAVMAFLLDDVDAWMAWYGANDTSKCWGAGEDRQMLRGIVARKAGLAKPDAKSYQTWHNALAPDKRAKNWEPLEEDGKLGPITRAQLIGDYMNLDGTTLPTNMRVVIHGCGEAFPLPPAVNGCAWERFSEMRNRRVEFFFFEQAGGVAPSPASNTSALGSTEYPAWLAKAEVEDLTTEAGLKEVTFVEMHDALFRTNSAVVLPEGEDPTTSKGGGRAVTAVGLFATVLRYNEEHPSSVDATGKPTYKKLLIAGHTDTKGSDKFNQPLSEERAKVTLALLTGGTKGREDFAKLCQKRHDGVDLTQIFHWVADSTDFEFKCKPTLRDQAPSTTTVTHFKQEYNAHFDAKFADMPGAKKFASPNGNVDEALWGAIFDCYEYGLRCELGDMEKSKEGTAEVAQLRSKLNWVDSTHQTMGFGERFPVDNMTKQEFRSQSNRRVEVMMFDEGEEPDLAAAAADPEVMETYLPGAYGKNPVPPMVSARPWRAYWEKKVDPTTGEEMPARMGEPRKMILDAPGLAAGTIVTWTVEELVDGGSPRRRVPMSVLANSELVHCEFLDWFDGGRTEYEPTSLVSEFPKVSFRFVAASAGREKRSGILEYRDFLKASLKLREFGTALPDMPCELATAWGRKGIRIRRERPCRV
ncbi:MAG: OmpA family protein [Polyangiaceae bacterium]